MRCARVSKPFVLAMVMEEVGSVAIRTQIGVNATGYPFNAATPIELNDANLTNPMVNAGAIATTALIPGANVEEKWEVLLANLSRFAGRRLELDGDIFASASASNHRNRALANLLVSLDRLDADPVEVVDL